MKSEGKEMQRASRAKGARGAGSVIDCKGRTSGIQGDLTDASPYQTSWRTASQPASQPASQATSLGMALLLCSLFCSSPEKGVIVIPQLFAVR